MWSKVLAFLGLQQRIEVANAQTISVGPNDFLVVKVSAGASQAILKQLQQHCREFFGTQRVLVVAGDDFNLVKVAIEEKLVDDIMLKEEITKWQN